MSYDADKLLQVDMAKVKTDISKDYQPAIKTVYSDYSDVSIILGSDDEVPFAKSLTVYPNPGTGIFYIKTEESTPLEIKLYNRLGTMIFSDETIDKQLDLSNLPPGVYLLQCSSGTRQYLEKIVLQ